MPGGIGIAISSVATVSDARDTLRSKTAAQVIAETRATLLAPTISPLAFVDKEAEIADDVEIHIIDPDDRHIYQPGLLFVPFGLTSLDEIVRPRTRSLKRPSCGMRLSEMSSSDMTLMREMIVE